MHQKKVDDRFVFLVKKFKSGSNVMNIQRMANAPYLNFNVPWSIVLMQDGMATQLDPSLYSKMTNFTFPVSVTDEGNGYPGKMTDLL